MSKKNPPRHPGRVRKEPPRFLAANPGASGPRYLRDQKGELILDENDRPQLDPKDDGVRDYTTRRDKAVFGEGECPPATLVDEYAKENNRRFAQAHEDEAVDRQARVIAAKLASIQREGLKLGIDFGPQLAQFVKQANAEIAAKRRLAA